MSGNTFGYKTATFSAGYAMVPEATVLTAEGAHAQMDTDLFHFLQRYFGENFIGKVEELRYQFQPTRSVPADAVVVPEGNHDDPETFLVQR